MKENKTNDEKGLFALAIGAPLLVLTGMCIMFHEVMDVRPREIGEYKQMIENRGETFKIEDYYDSIKPRYHHRFSDVSVHR